MKDNSHIAAAAICVAAVLLCIYLISVAYRRTRRKIRRLMNSTEVRLVREVVRAIEEGEKLSEIFKCYDQSLPSTDFAGFSRV